MKISFQSTLLRICLFGATLWLSGFSAIAQTATNCLPVPANAVSWWRAAGNPNDTVGGNNGALQGNASYGSGRVGLGFAFDGNGDGVALGNPASLRLQNFSIEMWIQRSSTSVSSQNSNEATLISYGGGGYGFTLFDNGNLSLTRVGVDNVIVGTGITDLNWHHVAVTKTNGIVVFYVDGVAFPASAYNSTFTFNSTLAIGTGNTGYGFYGLIDEPAIYSRALAANEIQAIYNANASGKCYTPMAPTITSQPASQSAYTGETVSFSVAVFGEAPLRYQWLYFGTNVISGATNASFLLDGLQVSDTGEYSVVISNSVGDITSSNALLIVNSPPPCTNAPAGLVSWWRAEGDALDYVELNNGVMSDDATFGKGKVGQSFVFDGDGDAVVLGNPASLHLQDFSIEMWIKRSSASVSSLNANEASLLSYGQGGIGFTLFNDGKLSLTCVGVDNVIVETGITDLNWHHVAVTKTNSTVVFYVDGIAFPVPAYNPTFTFTSVVRIGSGNGAGYGFYGAIDELAIYNRVLTINEVRAIYHAAISGKCVTPKPPFITIHPISRAAYTGQNITLSVVATGSQPLNYQWLFNSTNIIGGATNSSLTISNVQMTDGGFYSVTVTNVVGGVVSSNAVLSVSLAPPCAPINLNLVSWWRAEGNSEDYLGETTGALVGHAGFTDGQVGQAFTFDGNGDGVALGNPASLRLQNFSIEMWIKRSNPSVSSQNSNEGTLISYGGGGYGLTLYNNGNLSLTRVGVDNVIVGTAIMDLNWHHVAVTKTNGTVVFYVDGVAFPAPAYNPTFTFNSTLAVGTGNTGYGFYGLIDEPAIYSRALGANEIEALYNSRASGKCAIPIAPSISSFPGERTVLVGTNVTFAVTATGSKPFTYQWRYNETNAIAGATNATLTLSNIGFADAGNYSVVVSNVVGSATSSNAVLTVVYPPAVVRIVGNNNVAVGTVATVPVRLVANGNENALSLSVSFNTNLMAFNSVVQGSNAANASLFYNTSQTNSGRIGLLLGLGAGQTFAPGTQEVARVSFDVIAMPASTNRTATLTFVDTPTPRQLSDVTAVSLSAFYSNTSLTIPAADWEADTAPRTNGNKVISATDWVQVGRFVAHLDVVNDGSEYQRADCAPRGTLGNGVLSITDWVQAGRYVAGLDPLTVVGGPSSETLPELLRGGKAEKPGPSSVGERTLQVVGKPVQAAVTNTITVELNAQGNENALGFSLHFNPALLQFVTVSLGSGASGALFNPNTGNVAAGDLGVALALPTGVSFTPGTVEVAKINFVVAPLAVGSTDVVFVNNPVRMEVSDAGANALATSYVPGTLTINPFPPILRIGKSDEEVTLSWPVTTSNFVLQVSDAVSGNWTNAASPLVIGPDNVVTTTNTGGTRFYRLLKP